MHSSRAYQSSLLRYPSYRTRRPHWQRSRTYSHQLSTFPHSSLHHGTYTSQAAISHLTARMVLTESPVGLRNHHDLQHRQRESLQNSLTTTCPPANTLCAAREIPQARPEGQRHRRVCLDRRLERPPLKVQGTRDNSSRLFCLGVCCAPPWGVPSSMTHVWLSPQHTSGARVTPIAGDPR